MSHIPSLSKAFDLLTASRQAPGGPRGAPGGRKGPGALAVAGAALALLGAQRAGHAADLERQAETALRLSS